MFTTEGAAAFTTGAKESWISVIEPGTVVSARTGEPGPAARTSASADARAMRAGTMERLLADRGKDGMRGEPRRDGRETEAGSQGWDRGRPLPNSPENKPRLSSGAVRR